MPFIRYISLDGITFHIFLIIYFFKMSSLNLVYASVPMLSRGLQILFCFIRLFVSPFGLPFLKLSLPFLRLKELLNSGQQRSRKRVDLIVRYPRIVFLSSGHSADKIPSFRCFPVRLFVLLLSRIHFYLPFYILSTAPFKKSVSDLLVLKNATCCIFLNLLMI